MMKCLTRSALFALVALGAALPRCATAALAPANVTTTGDSVTTTVLSDQSTVVKFLADGTFTVPDGAMARLLLVGGGGGGGAECGGGGGAGGFVEASDVVLASGTYTVTVGARGEGGNTALNGGVKQGGNGGNTVLSFGGADLYTAVGGGGGGVWSSVAGSAGGSGGGGANTAGVGGAGTEGQGFAGGAKGGGGGGAGGPGGDGSGNKNAGTNGAGGPGKASDITGEQVYYAGGGGGGGYNDNPGSGGIGGGGNGMRDGNEATRIARSQAEFDAEAGVDGLGGGGGGGNNSNAYYGRPGGSGVLIVRLAPAGPEPQISMLGATDGPASAVVKVRLVSVGDGASSASFSYKVANSAAGLDAAEPVAAASDVAAGAIVSIRISNLTPGGTTYVRILAENNLDVYSTPVDTTVHPHSCYATFTVAGYSGSALANFPVLVRLSADSPAGFSYDDCAQDGSDIRFVDSDGNLVPHEIDTWNRNGESLIWVALPVMNAGTTFTMYYGSIASPGATAAGSVWARYAVVIHGGSSLANAVVGGVAVSAGSDAVSATAGSGIVGGGVNKSTASAKGVNVVNPAKAGALANNNEFSLSCWFKRTGSGTAILAGSRTSWNSQPGFLWLQEKSDRISVAANNSHQLTTNNKKILSTVSWTHLAFTVDDTVELKSYFDGAPDQSKDAPATLINTSNDFWTFGSYCDTASNDSYSGDMDELRIFNGVASGDWIKAEHDTVASTTFLSADAVVHAGASAAPQVGIVASSVEYTNATFSVAVGSLGMDAGMTTPATWTDLLLVVGTEETLSSPAFAVPLSRATEAPVQIPASLAGLNAETVYYAQIRATNSLGVAGESRVAAFATLPPGPAFTATINSDHIAPVIALSFIRTGLASSVTQITVRVSSTGDFDNPDVSKTMEVDLAEMPVMLDNIDITGLPATSTLSYRFIAENAEGFSTVVDASASSSIGDGNNVWSGLSEDIDDPNAYVFAGGLPAPGKTLYFTKPAGLSPVIDRDVDMPSLRFTSKANESVDADYLGGFHSCGYNLSGSGVLTFTAEKPIVQASYGTNTISNPIRFSRTDSQSVTVMSVGGDTTWLNLDGSLLLPDGVANTKMQVTGQGNTVLGGASPDFMGQLSVDGGRLTFANSCAMTNVSSFYFSGDPASMSNATGASLVFPRVTSVRVNSGWQGRKLHLYGAPFVFPQATFDWAIRDYNNATFDADCVVSNLVVQKNTAQDSVDAAVNKNGTGAFIVTGETSWYDASVKSYVKITSGCFWPAGLPPSGEIYLPGGNSSYGTLGLSGDYNPMLNGSSSPRLFQSSSQARWGFTGFGGERTVCWNGDQSFNLTNTSSYKVETKLTNTTDTNTEGKTYDQYYAYPACFMFGNRSEYADGTIIFMNPIRYELSQNWDALTCFESTNHIVAARMRGSLKLGNSGKTWNFSGRNFGGYLALEAENTDFTGNVNVYEKGNLLVNSNLVAQSATVQSGSGLGGTGSLSTVGGTTVKSGGALFGGEWNKGGTLTIGGKLTFEGGSSLRVEAGALDGNRGCVKLAAGATLKLTGTVYVDVDTDPRVSADRGVSRKVLDWSEASFDSGSAPTRENFVVRPERNADLKKMSVSVREDGLYVGYTSVRCPVQMIIIVR